MSRGIRITGGILIAARDRDTIVSRSVTGKPARMLRAGWAELYERGEIEPLPMPYRPPCGVSSK